MQMLDESKTNLYFPHTIATNVLGGKKHVWNDVNGGTAKIADLCLEQNSFWGGNVIVFGWIKEYGMYACPHKDTNEILGFYIPDPNRLTELGKRLVMEAFPLKHVHFEFMPKKEVTREQLDELERTRQYYRDHGMEPEYVDNSNAEELKALYKAVKSGKAEKPMAVAEPVKYEPFSKDKVEVEHDGSTVSPKILEGRVQPRKRT